MWTNVAYECEQCGALEDFLKLGGLYGAYDPFTPVGVKVNHSVVGVFSAQIINTRVCR